MSNTLFSPRRFEVNWCSHFHNINNTVSIPDLSNLEYSSEGDWGPMYSFTLNPNKLVEISYFSNETKSLDSYYLEEKVLAIEIPMLFEVRSITPLVYRVYDKIKDIELRFYVNDNFDSSEFQIKNIDDHSSLYSALVYNSSMSVVDVNNNVEKIYFK